MNNRDSFDLCDDLDEAETFFNSVKSNYSRTTVRVLVVDLSWPLDGETCANLRVVLERLFAVTCSLAGPQRIHFFGLICLGDCPQVLFPLQHVRGNYPRLHAALQELAFIHSQQVHPGISDGSGLSGCIHKALSMFRKHAQCAQQNVGCWYQLEITMVTGRNITTVAKQVEKSTQDLDLDSLQKVQIVCISSPSTLTQGDLQRSTSSQGSNESDQSNKSEPGGLVDLLTVDNDPTSIQGVFTGWLHDVGTDREHLHLVLPDAGSDGSRVLQCDIHERLLNPAQLPFPSQFSLTLDSKLSNVRPTLPSSSKGAAGGATVAVDTLRVIRRIPSDAVCESVLYGMPLLVHATSCWKTDWDELEENRHNFQALAHLLQHKNEVLLARLEPRPSPTPSKSFSPTPPPTPPSGHFLLLPSTKPCELLLKAVAVSELLLPWTATLTDDPTQENLSTMDACLSQVVVEASYNPLLYQSGLCESLVNQLSTKGRPLSITGRRPPQIPSGNNRSCSATYQPTDELRCTNGRNARQRTGRDIYGKALNSFPTEL